MRHEPCLWEAVKNALLLLSLAPVIACAASSSLQFVPSPHSSAQGVVPLPHGSVAVYGTINNYSCTANPPGSCDQTEFPLFSILDVSGNQIASLANSALGSGNSSIAGATVDANGNFWIVGQTDSDDFPLVHALYTQKAAYQQTGFVARLDPSLNILFSTFLGGYPALGKTTVLRVAVDGGGNAYVAGSTHDANFPTTGPTFGVGAPEVVSTLGGPATYTYTFLVKISPGGLNILTSVSSPPSLVFSRFLGGNGYSTQGCFETCYERSVETTPYALAVGTDGSATITGSSVATNFPITVNINEGGGAFVSRISADGSQLMWSTGLGFPMFPGVVPTSGFINSVALDSANNVYLTGFTFGPIPTTPGALQSQAQLVQMGQTEGNGFVVKLSSDGTQVLFATNLTATIAGVTLDSAGNAWITGNTVYSTSMGKVNATSFPGLSNIPSIGLDFALELNSDASAIKQIFSFLAPTATQPPAFDSNGDLLLLAPAGNLLRLNMATALTAPAVFAITNSAVPQATAGAASGELTTLYGVGLGPAVGVTGEPGANGLYPTQLGGVSVNVGGVAAPLLYVGPNQINLQVPFFGPQGPTVYAVTTPSSIVVTTPTGTLPALQPQVAGSLGVFGVENADGSINSASNPAPEGSVVVLYLTGLGQAVYQAESNGAIATSANSAFLTDIQITYLDLTFGVLYAGTAPYLINGLDQVNVQLPFGPGNYLLAVQTIPTSVTVSTSAGTTMPIGSAVISNVVTVYTH